MKLQKKMRTEKSRTCISKYLGQRKVHPVLLFIQAQRPIGEKRLHVLSRYPVSQHDMEPTVGKKESTRLEDVR